MYYTRVLWCFANNIWQLILKIWYSFEELSKMFSGLNAIVSNTFYRKVCNICYCNVSCILSLKVHEKAKCENCVIKFILKEWHYDHLFSNRNKVSQILLDSQKIHVAYVTLPNWKSHFEFFACCILKLQSLFDFY